MSETDSWMSFIRYSDLWTILFAKGTQNQNTTANAGWRTQFRVRGSHRGPDVAEFCRATSPGGAAVSPTLPAHDAWLSETANTCNSDSS